MRKFISLFAAMLVVVAVNAAGTINVSGGTQTLKAAFDAAEAGSTLVLADGTYDETERIVFSKDITIEAAKDATPVVKFVKDNQIKSGAKVKFVGIKFDGSAMTGTYEYAIRSYDESEGKEIRLDNCEVTGFASASTNYFINAAGASRTLDSIIITNCYFHDTKGDAVYVGAGSETLETCKGVIVKNSTFANLKPYHSVIEVDNYNKTVTDNIEVTVDHCTFYNDSTSADGYAGVRSYKSTKVNITNSIFAHPESYARCGTYCYGGVVSNNLTHNLTLGDKGHNWDATRINNIAADPLFDALAQNKYSYAGNWVTMELSPARAAGTDGSDLGDPRWYTAEVLPQVDFASPYQLVGAKAVIAGNIWYDSENALLYYNDKAECGTAVWKIHASKACELAATLNVNAGSTTGHKFKIEVLKADGTLAGELAEAAQSAAAADIELTGTIELPAEGDYVIRLSNLTGWSSAKIDGITFAEVAPALEPATFYGATSFITEGTNPGIWTAVEYNITRKADKTLAFELTWTGDVVGIVPQLKIGEGGFTNMAVEGKKATMNPADTYEDDATVNVEFYIAYAGAAKSIPVAYTVGATNEKPATPVEPVFFTISATANIEAAGTITGAGKVQEGESVTVKATANAGYHFCGWQDGETSATRTFTATKDETFVALFRANVANPYAYALTSTYDDETKKLSVEYALNAPADKVEIVVYNGNDEIDAQEQAAEGLTVGKHTATISCDAFAPKTKLTWAVRVNGLSPLAPVQHGTQYSMFCPHGVAVDNNPESEYFGRILATESMHSVTTKTLEAYISGTEANGAGIYAFSPDFQVIASAEGKNVFNGGNTFHTAFNDASYKSSAISVPFAPLRIRISDDGRIFATALDDYGVLLWEISQDLKTWTPLLSGTLNEGVLRNEAGQYLGGLMPSLEVVGSGEDLKLLALSCNKAGFTAYSGKNYFAHEYKIGTATTLTAAPDSLFSLDGVSSAIVANQASLVPDGQGGYWLGNSRSAADQVQLAHLNAQGKRDWYAETGGFYGGGGVMFKDGLLYIGKDRTSSSVGNFGIYSVNRDEQGVVTGIKQEFAVRCDGIGRNINDFAMDFGHNLFIVGNSNEKIEQFALPYDGENETPAAQKFAFYVGGEPTAITTINDELVPVEKVIRNGEVLIIRDGKTYNMMGQSVR